jgi:DDE superfamily endonuclease
MSTMTVIDLCASASVVTSMMIPPFERSFLPLYLMCGRTIPLAFRERRKIVFIDESGLSERPHRVSTWAPRGQTPVLQYHFHWKTLSAIAGVTVWRFHFRLYEGTIRKEEVVAFLRHLRRHVRGELLIIWDHLKQHQSRVVKDYVASQRGAIELE